MHDVKEELAAALAHEVKNPVSLIKANVQLIRDGLTDEADKNFQIIDKELNKINTLINDFTTLSKETSREKMEKIFIQDLIDDVVEDYDISLKRRQINFEIMARRENISYMGDYNKICILFFNVIKNAVEAIEDKGKIEIEISDDDRCVEISIKDDGVGIDEDFLQRVGHPFVTSKEDGSGLGIAICKSIVEEHGGFFELKNNEDKGCVVHIKLNKDGREK